jgi:hypothetical protein
MAWSNYIFLKIPVMEHPSCTGLFCDKKQLITRINSRIETFHRIIRDETVNTWSKTLLSQILKELITLFPRLNLYPKKAKSFDLKEIMQILHTLERAVTQAVLPKPQLSSHTCSKFF